MTLIEVLVVVALSSIVMGVLISLTVSLKQRDRTIRSFALECERQSDLAELLRNDIRGAVDVSLSSERVLLVTRPDDGVIRYELAATDCRRTVSEPGGAKPRFDSFAIGEVSSWSLEPGPPGRRPLFVVTLNRPRSTAEADSQPAPLLVFAVLGADVPIAARAAMKAE